MRVRFCASVSIAVAISLSLTLAVPASAAIWDPPDTSGPLDVRWVNVKPLTNDRLKLTFGFWAGFRKRALAGDSVEGFLMRFYLPEFNFVTYGYTTRKDGQLRFRQGDFGSSTCCYVSRLTRLGPRTFTTTFLPWWIRTDGDDSRGVRYSAQTRLCRRPCLVDHTHTSVVA